MGAHLTLSGAELSSELLLTTGGLVPPAAAAAAAGARVLLSCMPRRKPPVAHGAVDMAVLRAAACEHTQGASCSRCILLQASARQYVYFGML
jgi:hypothetical protein